MAVDMSQHFTTGGLLRFTAPSVGMLIFISIYSVVDGFFVSNFVGSSALAAVNLAFPVVMILGTIGYMMGTGGSALVGKVRGEGDDERANRLFSLFVYASIVGGLLFTAIGIPLLRPLFQMMGATGDMLELAVEYGTILMVGLVFDVLQYSFQSFIITAGKPSMGFMVTVAAGVTNMALDVLFIGVFGWGVAGAAWATVAGVVVGGLVPLVYFARPNDSALRLCKTRLDWRSLGKAAANGLSEMVTNIAISLVSIVYNIQLISMIGADGVAAYGVIMYVMFVFAGAFLGYSVGCAPLMSFQYGAQNKAEMQSLFKKSIGIIGICGILMFAATRVAAAPLAGLFVGYDEGLLSLTEHAFTLYSSAFLLMGFNVYASSLFTSLGNGLVSALISFLRSLVIEIGSVILLPMVLGPDGIWLSVVVAEAVAIVISGAFVLWLAPHYGYLRKRTSA
ncbi:MAG: MATE family efflux transporter [Eggerthellaceae bacterium]|nr:MATE family efflux transporter [Eggerthellaceae bacterium]